MTVTVVEHHGADNYVHGTADIAGRPSNLVVRTSPHASCTRRPR